MLTEDKVKELLKEQINSEQATVTAERNSKSNIPNDETFSTYPKVPDANTGKVAHMLLGFLNSNDKDVFPGLSVDPHRQLELKTRIESNGDVVGLHHLPEVQTEDGITMVLNAGLIPELKGSKDTAIGRKQYPESLLAQSVATNELLAAVEAGADMLVASTLLSKEEISEARYEAHKLGKSVSIVVGIDPTAPNVKEQISLAVTSGADGIKLKPAGKDIEKTLEYVEYTQKEHPNLLLLVAGGVKAGNRSAFAVKAGIGADTLDEIDSLLSWAKRGEESNCQIQGLTS